MTLTRFAIALGAAIGWAEPVRAENPADLFARCFGESQTRDASAECVTLRSDYLATIQDCLARRDAATWVATGPDLRARRRVCADRAREIWRDHPPGCGVLIVCP